MLVPGERHPVRPQCLGGMIAAIEAWSLHSHMTEVALRFGERPEVACVLPFSVDGLSSAAGLRGWPPRRPATPCLTSLVDGPLPVQL